MVRHKDWNLVAYKKMHRGESGREGSRQGRKDEGRDGVREERDGTKTTKKYRRQIPYSPR